MITDRCDNKRHETKTYLRFVHDNKVLVVFKGPGLSPPLLLFTAEAFSLQTCQPTVCVLFDAREPTNQLFFTADIRAIGGRGISAQGWCLNRLSLVQMFDGQGIEPIMVRIDCTVWIVNKQSSCLSSHRGRRPYFLHLYSCVTKISVMECNWVLLLEYCTYKSTIYNIYSCTSIAICKFEGRNICTKHKRKILICHRIKKIKWNT